MLWEDTNPGCSSFLHLLFVKSDKGMERKSNATFTLEHTYQTEMILEKLYKTD